MNEPPLNDAPPATFAEARAKHLDRLEYALALVRVLAGDKDWLNPDSRQMTAAREGVEYALRAVCRLNQTEWEAN